MAKNTDLRDYHDAVTHKTYLTGGNSLQSLLIMPIQRIPRYRLLLEEIIKKTPEDIACFMNLKKALEEIKNVANIVNQSMKDGESRAKVLAIQSRIGNNRTLVAAARTFVMEGPLMEVDRKKPSEDLYWFLFNDLLIGTTHISF